MTGNSKTANHKVRDWNSLIDQGVLLSGQVGVVVIIIGGIVYINLMGHSYTDAVAQIMLTLMAVILLIGFLITIRCYVQIEDSRLIIQNPLRRYVVECKNVIEVTYGRRRGTAARTLVRLKGVESAIPVTAIGSRKFDYFRSIIYEANSG